MHIGAARRKNVLQLLGAIMAVTYLVMIQVDSIPLLLLVSVLNGVGWGFWPILSSVPFYIPGIRPREVAVGTSLVMTLGSARHVPGPACHRDTPGPHGRPWTRPYGRLLRAAVAGSRRYGAENPDGQGGVRYTVA